MHQCNQTGDYGPPYLRRYNMDLILVLLSVAGIAFLSGFLLGIFLGDKYFYIDVKRKHDPVPQVKGEVKNIDIIA